MTLKYKNTYTKILKFRGLSQANVQLKYFVLSLFLIYCDSFTKLLPNTISGREIRIEINNYIILGETHAHFDCQPLPNSTCDSSPFYPLPLPLLHLKLRVEMGPQHQIWLVTMRLELSGCIQYILLKTFHCCWKGATMGIKLPQALLFYVRVK